MRRVLLSVAAVALAAASLAACSSDPEATAPSASPSPTPTPTPSSVVWAGAVCVERDNLKAAVSALGRNLSYDVTSDRSAIEQIDRQLRLQVLSVANAADQLSTALQGVPVDFVAANDLVVTVTKAKGDTSDAVTQVTTSLDAAISADNILTGVAEAGKALVAAKAAFEAGQVLLSTVVDATSTASGELGDAFDAAPECVAAAS
ncbi:MAG: hypothetical protein NTX29_14305 [Actinobacteria bacterium]|nr:hypothetical protein [Actinomycetota bacterium]